jgi:hypothetical protein
MSGHARFIGTFAANGGVPGTHRDPLTISFGPMTHCDDELEYVCAWGRWRIDQARNEPVLGAAPEDGRPAPRRDAVAVHRPSSSMRRGRARLRLVRDGSVPLALVP